VATRLGLYGGPRPDYGSFSGKSQSGHPVNHITRLGEYGGPRGLYSSFEGKEAAGGGGAHPVPHITRLGEYGGPRGVYSSFEGKEPATAIAVVAVPHSTLGLFCDPTPGIAVHHATQGLFCGAGKIPVGQGSSGGGLPLRKGISLPQREWREREEQEIMAVIIAFLEMHE